LYFINWVKLYGDRKDISDLTEYLRFNPLNGSEKTPIKVKSE